MQTDGFIQKKQIRNCSNHGINYNVTLPIKGLETQDEILTTRSLYVTLQLAEV